jgi:Tol biopolymer transport system component
VRQARGLVPYAAFAVLLVGVSIAALLGTTLGLPISVAQPSPSRASAAPSAARPATDLSPSGRLAYWRQEANGEYLLWLANSDNSRRRSVMKEQPGAVARTKWAADGSAVAYVESGVRLVVVRVDGAKTDYTLAPELRADGYRIVDHRFSPSGLRIAATVQRATGSQTDVYISDIQSTWTRLTTTEDVIAADWLSEDELLVQTTGGIVGRLRASGRDQLRPLTGLPAATPIIADDGRIHFLSGRVSGFAGSNETLVYASIASIWSMTAEGEDLRREVGTLGPDAFRLDGQWPGGGYLLHRGTNPAQVAIGNAAPPANAAPIELPANAGLIERLAASSDRKLAIGFAGSNLVRLDITATGAATSAAVLLGSVSQGDVWFFHGATLARIAPARVDVPAARYVFALGGHLWAMGADGQPTLLRAGNTNAQTLRRFALGPPVWSPAGDRVVTVESLSTGTFAAQLVAVTIGRDGTARRYTSPSSIGPHVTWSADGAQLVVTALPAASTDPAVLGSDLSLTIIDAATGTVARTIPGREAVWTQGGIVVLTNGTVRSGDRARDAQMLEIWNGTQRKELLPVAKIVSDPRVPAPGQTRGLTQATGLTAAPDGAYAAMHVDFLGTSPTISFAIVRARDAVVTAVLAGDPVSDESWSSGGRYIGYTLISRDAGSPVGTADGLSRQRAVVRDAETGAVAIEHEGRFAGWSPDGLWTYIARSDGLYAKRLAGGDPVRFSPIGVPVSATQP